MIDSIDAAGRDEAVRVIVISAAGDHFCSGFDIVSRNADGRHAGHGSAASNDGCRRRPTGSSRSIINTQTPVVCRVQGWSAGIGLNLALAADFAVAADDARFWMPFVDRGFTPDSGATWLLPRRIGEVHAREMLLLARVVEASEAASWGMLHRIVPAGRARRRRRRGRGAARSRARRSRSGSRSGCSTAGADAAARASSERGVRDGAVVTERRLPRGSRRVPREARSRFQGPVSEWRRYDTLLVERQGPVGWIVFNRPQVGNAMNHSMMDELEAAWHELDDDPAVRVIVNTGEGKAFQTGLDIAELSRDPDALREQSSPHARRRARVHRVAAQGLEAGDRGGQRNRRRRWAPLRGRRRHRDRREQRHVPRPARVGRPGHRRTRRSG